MKTIKIMLEKIREIEVVDKEFCDICKKEIGDDHTEIIRYTDQLRDFGIYTDKLLAKWGDKDEEQFTWVNNPWFEVWDSVDVDYFSEPLFDLNDAIDYAKGLQEQYGDDGTFE
jgi:hypothetical protein